ncbi:MAG: allantoicase [Pseudomonadota bacterium]|nr:allantoicase [Pseudomonadota bacterium]
MSTPTPSAAFTGAIDLASAAVGGRALLCSDDFFAGMENLVRPEPAVFDPNAYTERGKLMDGWESRRKRVPGHDWCIVQLGVPGTVRAVDIDTAFFLGNHPPFASVDGILAPGATPEALRDELQWTEIVPTTPLRRGSQNLAAVVTEGAWTHLRLHIYPDGGVARLRAYGEPAPVEAALPIDLACATSGGRAIACSDAFFASMDNLLLPGRAPHMGHGWETRRSRPPGEDWIIVQLGRPGRIDRIDADTHHFKGNYPDRCAIEAIHWPGAPPDALVRSPDWVTIVPKSKLQADAVHAFTPTDAGPWTHVRLRIYPDGGVSRLRVYGSPTPDAAGRPDPLVTRINEDPDLAGTLSRCCGSRRWVAAMVAARPFSSRAHLFGEAERQWWRLGDGDWKEAFTHHPRIGADLAQLRAKYANTASWASGEQAGVSGASEEVLQALVEGNLAYEATFGHIFLVCATGRTASEMLAMLRERLENAPTDGGHAAELRIAAGEQVKITRLRLEKLLS